MSDFSIRRDWKKINWKATFQYNVFRSLCATPIWFLLTLIGPASGGEIPWPMLLFPVIYFAFWLPFGLITGWLAKVGVPFMWMLSIVSSLVIVVGDPIVWLISKIKPDLVPVEKPKFLDFHLIVFAIKNPDGIPPCDAAGRIISNGNIQFIGQSFPLRQTLFVIKPDWSVETLRDKDFGYIDINYVIRKGRLQKGVDPRETNIGEMVAYIREGICYNMQQQTIGQYDDMPEPVLTEREIQLNETVEKISEIEKYRRLRRSDFPENQNLCELAGFVHAFPNVSFLNNQWDENEVIFDINLLGEVKTPYDGEFGRVEGTGDVVKGLDENSTEIVAKIIGNYCYANNQKIGKFVPQTY